MSPTENNPKKNPATDKKFVLFFIISLILSGVTAFPIESRSNLVNVNA
ncbi:MAG: hypothetical protein WEB30_10940 [Cyclobacteriaceae bacterium]